MYGMTPMGAFFTAIFPLKINEHALCQQLQFVPKYSGFGELPNKHFCGPCALQKFRSVATPELLAQTRNPQHGAKKRRLRFLLRFLRFSCFL